MTLNAEEFIRLRAAVYRAAQRSYGALNLGDEDRQAPQHQKGDHCPARRLAMIMYRIWVNGTEFRRTREAAAAQMQDRQIGIGASSTTKSWNDVPRGTMDEVR